MRSSLTDEFRHYATVVALLLALTTTSIVAKYTNQIIVKIKPGVLLEDISIRHPAVKFEKETKFNRIFVFHVDNILDIEEETSKLQTDPLVAWAHINEITEQIPCSNNIPIDESVLSGQQWFHSIINSSYAWSKGFSGQGQLVQVIDTEFFPNEKDLTNQINHAQSFEGAVQISQGATHGTVCANLIAAKSNDYCGVGVAFSAKIAAFPFIQHPTREFTDLDLATAFIGGFPVSSNSYGVMTCNQHGCGLQQPLQPLLNEAFETAQARDNTIFVFASGNEGWHRGSSNYARFAGSPRIIAVGASTIDGRRASYSNGGSSLWMVAPAGDFGSNVTWSSVIEEGAQSCGDVGVGTSWAAPMVAGAAAVLRSAYPSLTWRDVKLILALSADRIDPTHNLWVRNSAGNWFNWFYGFGSLNVGNAVELASRWQSLGPLQIRKFSTDLQRVIPLSTSNPIFINIQVPHGLINKIESVQITIAIFVNPRGALRMDLYSPSGTPAILFPARNDPGNDYPFYTTAVNGFLGENPGGQWQLRVQVDETFVNLTKSGRNEFFRASLTVWGESSPSQITPRVSAAALGLSSFTIQEGENFQRLSLAYHAPASLGLFWRDDNGLYGEVFDTLGATQTGTQQINPANSNHPTVAIFSSGDHVLAYMSPQNNLIRIIAEVSNNNFIPLTPATTLPLTDVDQSFLSVAVLGNNTFAVSYRRIGSLTARLAVFQVNFGSRNVTPVCIPKMENSAPPTNVTDIPDDTECSEIIYQRDGSISIREQIHLDEISSQISLIEIGRGYVLGTWTVGNSISGTIFNEALVFHNTTFASQSLVTAVATAKNDIIFGFRFNSRVTLTRYNFELQQIDAIDIPIIDAVVNLHIQFSDLSDGVSLVIATEKNIWMYAFLRDSRGALAQTNAVTIADLLTPIQVLDIDQVVLPNGDVAVTYSTIQEIHVQVIGSSVFASLNPTNTPSDNNNNTQRLRSWVIALIVLSCLIVGGLVGVIIWVQIRKRRKTSALKDEPLITYDRME